MTEAKVDEEGLAVAFELERSEYEEQLRQLEEQLKEAQQLIANSTASAERAVTKVSELGDQLDCCKKEGGELREKLKVKENYPL